MKSQRLGLIILVFMVIFTACVLFVYKLNITVKDNIEWRNSIMNLRILNKQIDAYFKTNLSNIKYDDINAIFSEFYENLQILSSLDSFSVLSEIYGNENDLNIIQTIYEKKRDLLDRFNYVAAGATAFLIDSDYTLSQQRNKISFIEALLVKLKNIDYTKKELLNQLEAEIEFLSVNIIKDSENTNNKSQLLALQKANFVLSSLIAMHEMHSDNEVLNLSNYLDNILIAYDHQHSRISDLLQVFMFIAFLMFYVLIVVLILQGVGIYKDQKEMAMLKAAISNSFGSIIFTDTQNKITYVNKAFELTNKYTLEEIKGKSPNILKSFYHSEEFYDKLKDTIYNNNVWSNEELISKTKDDEYIYEKVQFIPFEYSGKLAGFIGLKQDKTYETKIIKELEQKTKQAQAQSVIDKMTGFGNYFAITERLDEGRDGIIINITIKNFDNLRFFYQTKTVEAMLVAFANTLKLCVETSDIKAELFRFQDDEFYIWYRGDDLNADVALLQSYFSFSNLDITIENKIERLPGLKAIIGVSLSMDTTQTNRLMQAILANQQAKKLGNDIYFYRENDAIELRYYKNQITTQLIEYALENDTVIVECQGIYDVKNPDKQATYYEVLVRLIDQSGKIRYPGEFLEVAMQAQLYTQITKKVIEHAFALVERYPNYTFSINLSGIDIIDSSVREFLEEKLTKCTRPEHVCFELLESEEVSDYSIVNSFIKHIKGYGSSISIDDFGSGYSNYYRILELDIDNIKIDGSIIKKLPFDQNSRYLLETIINFASKQGYTVIAEFVSSPEILEELKKFNVPYAQGFLLGKPKSVDLL